jgi:hypothetical protein
MELQEYADYKQQPKPQWCTMDVFSRSQKRRAQRIHCRELKAGEKRHYDEDDEQQHVQKVVVTQGVVSNPSASGGHQYGFFVPHEFKAMIKDDIDTEEKTATQLLLDPQQAIF